jgi:hypothetical protein
MGVIHKKDQPDKTTELTAEVEELRGQVEQLKGQEPAAAQLMGIAFQAAVMSDRVSGTNHISDAMILSSTQLVKYPEWKAGTDYTKGEILLDGESGLYFEVIAAHKSNKAYPIATTFAYYRLIELEHTGTIEDPIPYPEITGILVNVKKDLYYSYKGEVYKAKADMPNCVYPPDTVGMWQWEKQ